MLAVRHTVHTRATHPPDRIEAHMTTITPDARRELALVDYENAIASGLAFHRIAASNRSADQLNYRHMVPAETYGRVVATLGTAARMGDFYAEAASQALRAVSPFLNDWQIVAGIADAFALFASTEWNDTRSATGPEAGRPSSHRHEVSLRQKLTLHAILLEVETHLQLGHVVGLGWALTALLLREEVRVNAAYLPQIGGLLAIERDRH